MPLVCGFGPDQYSANRDQSCTHQDNPTRGQDASGPTRALLVEPCSKMADVDKQEPSSQHREDGAICATAEFSHDRGDRVRWLGVDAPGVLAGTLPIVQAAAAWQGNDRFEDDISVLAVQIGEKRA